MGSVTDSSRVKVLAVSLAPFGLLTFGMPAQGECADQEAIVPASNHSPKSSQTPLPDGITTRLTPLVRAPSRTQNAAPCAPRQVAGGAIESSANWATVAEPPNTT